MGFRNPITSAVDQEARDLAADAYAEATAGIIPGSRIAADAIDGKTITGATLRSTPVPGSGRGWTADANGHRWRDDAGATSTEVRSVDGRLIARGATITGVLRTAEAAQPRAELTQQAGRGQLAFFTEAESNGGEFAAMYGGGGLRYEYFAANSHGYLTVHGGADQPGGQLNSRMVLGNAQGSQYAHLIGPSDVWISSGGAVRLDGDDGVNVGAGPVVGSGEWATAAGMRSKWHAWTVDTFDLRFLQPPAAWVPGLCHYVVRGGWCHLTVRLDRAAATPSWPVNTTIITLPQKLWPTATLDVTTAHPNTGVPNGMVRIRDYDGAVYMVSSGSAGVAFSTTWPVANY